MNNGKQITWNPACTCSVHLILDLLMFYLLYYTRNLIEKKPELSEVDIDCKNPFKLIVIINKLINIIKRNVILASADDWKARTADCLSLASVCPSIRTNPIPFSHMIS